MEVFKLYITDMMGFTKSERYFIDQDKAVEAFNEKIEEYRENKHLASKEDAEEHNISSESISIKDNSLNHIKSAMVCLWYKCSYEYDEWDITVEHLELDKIEIEE